jgi:hypothetical protein
VRFRTQVPAPGSEKAGRTMIEDLAAHTELQWMFSGLGHASQLIFKKVYPDGTDVYRVVFEKGSATLEVSLSADGAVSNASFVPDDY